MTKIERGLRPRREWTATLRRMTSNAEPPDAASVWRLYAAHAAIVFSGGPAPSAYATDRSFFVPSGAQHVDLNQAALFGAATSSDAHEVLERIQAAGVPVLLGCSNGVEGRVGAVLADAGFRWMPNRERLFWMPGAPEPAAHPAFEVRRVATDADVAAMQAIFAEAHDYAPELIGAMYRELLRSGDAASGWLAWDGDEFVSFAIVTQAQASLGLWEVMTPVRHRRRGAARTLVATALAAVARTAGGAGRSIEQTLFWSSPAGQPLYESMGFRVADTVDVWTLGASEADLAAVGAS